MTAVDLRFIDVVLPHLVTSACLLLVLLHSDRHLQFHSKSKSILNIHCGLKSSARCVVMLIPFVQQLAHQLMRSEAPVLRVTAGGM